MNKDDARSADKKRVIKAQNDALRPVAAVYVDETSGVPAYAYLEGRGAGRGMPAGSFNPAAGAVASSPEAGEAGRAKRKRAASPAAAAGEDGAGAAGHDHDDDACDNPVLDAALESVEAISAADGRLFERAIVSTDGSVDRLHRRLLAHEKVLSSAGFRALKRALDFED